MLQFLLHFLLIYLFVNINKPSFFPRWTESGSSSSLRQLLRHASAMARVEEDNDHLRYHSVCILQRSQLPAGCRGVEGKGWSMSSFSSSSYAYAYHFSSSYVFCLPKEICPEPDCAEALEAQREEIFLTKCPPPTPCPTSTPTKLISVEEEKSEPVCQCHCAPAECNCNYDGKASLLLREAMSGQQEIQSVLKAYGNGLTEAVAAREELRSEVRHVLEAGQRSQKAIIGRVTRLDDKVSAFADSVKSDAAEQGKFMQTTDKALQSQAETLAQVRHVCSTREVHDRTLAKMHDELSTCQTSPVSDFRQVLDSFRGEDCSTVATYLDDYKGLLQFKSKEDLAQFLLVMGSVLGVSLLGNLLSIAVYVYHLCKKCKCWLPWRRRKATAASAGGKPAREEDDKQRLESLV
jgi:hypothetical protein